MNLCDRTLAEICHHAAAVYPRECCGMIHQSGRVRRCQNIAPRPHRYETAADDVLALFESQSSPDPIRILYHSHPDAPATWSAADALGAKAIGEPLTKKLTWLIIECRRGCPVRWVSYIWHPLAAVGFDEVMGGPSGLIRRLEGTTEVFHSRRDANSHQAIRFGAPRVK